MLYANTSFAQTQEAEAPPRTFSITCFGSQDVCAEWHNPGNNVWHRIPGGRVYEAPYPFEFGRVCPEGNTLTNKLFLFDPGSTTKGIGFIGCQACMNGAANYHIIATHQAYTQAFTDYQAWVDAQGPHPLQ